MWPTLSPSTLQTARLAQGLTLESLANKSGMSAPMLSRLENGSRPATPDETAILAEALGIPVAALARPLVSERLGLSGFYHRKMSRAGARVVNKIEHQCLLDVVALRELLGLVEMDYPESVVSIHLDEMRSVGDRIEEAAKMVRLQWGLPRGPIENLCAAVERAGCMVIHSSFGVPEMDALYQKVRGMPPIFWVNSGKPLDRVRFSIAHELGHLVLHEDAPVDDKVAEEQADAFAAAFLMPASEFRAECPSKIAMPHLIELQRRWRCSLKAIVRRAKDVGRITPEQYKYLVIQIGRDRAAHTIVGESPTRLAATVQRCREVCGFTDEELAHRLAISVEQVQHWQQPFPGQKPVQDFEGGGPRLRLATGF